MEEVMNSIQQLVKSTEDPFCTLSLETRLIDGGYLDQHHQLSPFEIWILFIEKCCQLWSQLVSTLQPSSDQKTALNQPHSFLPTLETPNNHTSNVERESKLEFSKNLEEKKIKVEHQPWISSLVEFIIIFGLVPQLSIKWICFPLKSKRLIDIYLSIPNDILQKLKQEGKSTFLTCLNSIFSAADEKNLFNLIFSNHLHDLLCILIDLIPSSSHLHEHPKHPIFLKDENINDWAKKMLKKMLHDQRLPTLDQCFFIINFISFLKSTNQNHPLIPITFQCLTLLMIHPKEDGLISIVSVFATLQDQVYDAFCTMFSKIVCTLPKSMSCNMYWKIISKQLISMMHGSKRDQEIEIKYKQILVPIFKQIFGQFPTIGIQHFLIPISSLVFSPYIALFHLNLIKFKSIDDMEHGDVVKEIKETIANEKKTNLLEINEKSFFSNSERNQITSNESIFNSQKSCPLVGNLLIDDLLSTTKEWHVEKLFKTYLIQNQVQQKINENESSTVLDNDIFCCIDQMQLVQSLYDIGFLISSSKIDLSWMDRMTPLMPCIYELWRFSLDYTNLDDGEDFDYFKKWDNCVGKSLLDQINHLMKDWLKKYFQNVSISRSLHFLIYLSFYHNLDWSYMYESYKIGQDVSTLLPKPIMFEFEMKKKLTLIGRFFDPEKKIIFDSRSQVVDLVECCRLISNIIQNTNEKKRIKLDQDDTRREKNNFSQISIISYFFIHLLEKLWIQSSSNSSSPDQFISSINQESYIYLLQLILAISDQFGPDLIMSNPIQICLFLKTMLLSTQTDILYLALSLLEQVIENQILDESQSSILLNEMVTNLRLLSDHQDLKIRNESKNLIQLIFNLNRTNSKYEKKKSNQISNPMDPMPAFRLNNLPPHVSTVEEAIDLIESPIVPLKAGGLISLRRLILLENSTTFLHQFDRILTLFSSNLSHEDSYVYLNAIQGIAAIADLHFIQTFPVLQRAYMDSKRSIEIRLNVGEAILLVARRLGKSLVQFLEIFMNFLLSNIEHESEPILRASTLVDLGEVCESVRFALLPYIQELIHLMIHLLQFEKHDLVRLGTIHFIGKLIRGLSKEVLDVVPLHDLQRIASLLQNISINDQDEKCRFHSQHVLGLMEMNVNRGGWNQVEIRSEHPLLEPTGYNRLWITRETNYDRI